MRVVLNGTSKLPVSLRVASLPHKGDRTVIYLILHISQTGFNTGLILETGLFFPKPV
jgi:hypothetical protein